MESQYESLVTGRAESLFAEDMRAREGELLEAIRGSRVAVVGAAGSIGSAVVKALLRHRPAALSLIDLNENNLVELVRDLRSSAGLRVPDEFVTMPIGLGSVEFDRYFAEEKPFQFFFNLCAIKHVRSERNIYCLIRMIDTNVLFLHDFLEGQKQPFQKVFSVSSDKAANPANLMGATKMIMERALLAGSQRQPFSTARFANVAFSDGSLLHGFLQRIGKRQPISAPNDVRRYFISHQEAGELCLLSGALGGNREVFFPKLAAARDERTFAEIARQLLRALGYEPVECAGEEEAKARAAELIPRKAWPCHFFSSDTTGEKEFEEFYTQNETLDLERFRRIGIVRQPEDSRAAGLRGFLHYARAAKRDSRLGKDDYVREMLKVVPELRHLETGRSLDQKM